MASLMVKLVYETLQNTNSKNCLPLSIVRYSSRLPKQRVPRGTIKHRNLISSRFESLAARGFLRSYKPYTPEGNVKERVLELCNKLLGTNFDYYEPLSRENKFTLLTACFTELKHSVPNSLLHQIVNVEDVIKFYETPVSTTVPYDDLKNQELPPNLHIQYDYLRFDPATDTKFKGISAFPRSSTIVTGLKSKEKYKGHKAKSPFLDTEAIYKDRFTF